MMVDLVRKPASSTASGELTNDAQTIYGAKTFADTVGFTGTITPSGGIVGKTDGVAVVAGKLGQIITSGQQTNTLTTGQYDDTMSVTLTPGVWLVTFRGEIVGANASGYYSMFIGTVAGNNSTGSSAGVNFISIVGGTPVSGAQVAWCIGNYYVNITSNTTYYGKVFQSSGTANDARGIIEGVRIV